MSSGSKVGLLLALAILGSVGAYFAFGPGATGGPPLQVTDEQESGGRPPEPDDIHLSSPGDQRSGGALLSETLDSQFARAEERDPVIIIDDFGAGADFETSPGGGTLTDPDEFAIPDDPLRNRISDGGKDDVFLPTFIPVEDVATEDPLEEMAPEPAPEPAVPAFTEYLVRKDDSLWSIAVNWFGDGTKHHLIRDANPTVDPSRLQIGQTLRLPPKDAPSPPREEPGEGSAPAPDPQPPANTLYTVMPGDSLMSIARMQLGDESLWKALYEVNREAIGANPHDLQAGMALTLPR